MKRLVSGGVIVGISGIAACVGLHYSSTAQESVVVSPTSVDFGTTQIGVPVMQTITVSSASGSGDQDDFVMSVNEGCTDFSVDAKNLPAEVFRTCVGSASGTLPVIQQCLGSYDTQTYTFVATFTPSVVGVASCQVSISTVSGSGAGSANLRIALGGTGALPDFSIDVPTTPIDLGDVRVGSTSTPATLTIKNSGAMALTVSSVALADPTAYTLVGQTGSHTLATGANESFTLTCSPTAALAFDTTLTVSSTATNTPTVTVPVHCNGVISNLVVAPSPAAFATMRVGDAGDQTITIQNQGASLAQVTGVALGSATTPEVSLVGVAQLPLTLATSGAATTTSFLVHYAPTQAHSMGTLGTVEITNDGPTSPLVVNLSGEAVATSIGVNPAGIEFGSVCASSTATAAASVYANAAGGFVLKGLTAPASPFSAALAMGSFPENVVGNHGNEVMVSAMLHPLQAGDLTGTLSLETDIPGAPTLDVPLHGVALPDGITPSPSVLDFGTVMTDATTPGISFQLTNCSGAPLQIQDAHIDGVAANEFAIVLPSPQIVGRTLASTESEDFLVVMSPHADGGKTAILTIDYAGGSAMVELDGTAIGGATTAPTSRDSYYACSAGRSASAWPAVALLVALRRRRRR